MGTPNYKALFAAVATAKPMNNYADTLPEGKNRVTLLHFGLKESQKNEGTIVEAEFDCNGVTRGWAWWPERTGWSGAFNKDRLQRFIKAISESIGDTRGIEDVMGSLADIEQHGRGIVLDVEVLPATDKDGKPVVRKDGSQAYEANFKMVKQTLDDVKAVRAKFDGPQTASGTTAGAPALLGLGG